MVYSFELNETLQPHLTDCVGANWFSALSEQNETNFRGLVLHKINPEKVILLKELTNTKDKANMTRNKILNKINKKYLRCYDSIKRTISKEIIETETHLCYLQQYIGTTNILPGVFSVKQRIKRN